MVFSKRSFSVAWRLALLTPVFLAFQNCNQKMGTTSEVSGDMTTHVAVDMPQAKLEDLVRSYYVNILGRQPTSAELSRDLANIRGGLTLDTLQSQLAKGAEALTKLAEFLFQALGQNGTSNGNLNYLSNLLSNGTTLAQIRQLLGLPAATT